MEQEAQMNDCPEQQLSENYQTCEICGGPVDGGWWCVDCMVKDMIEHEDDWRENV